MINEAQEVPQRSGSWLSARGFKLSLIGIAAGGVIVRLALMAYWSLTGISYAMSVERAIAQWVILLIGLAILTWSWRQVWGRQSVGLR
jgi:hypothetical protein